MRHKFITAGLLLLAAGFFVAFIPLRKGIATHAANTGLPVYLNTSYSFEERAADLVSRLTLEEKQSQLGTTLPAIPRLGINAYSVGDEALHGVVDMMGAASIVDPSSFPTSIAIGAAWDPGLMEREATAISDEARSVNYNGITGLTFWSPVVEPLRDPRWGRAGESFGEDPFLVKQIASGFVRGFVGYDPVYVKVAATAKHYIANSTEFNRHVSSSDMDDRDMREYYLSPYKHLMEKERLTGIMTSYNAVNGVPTTASRFLVDTIARRTYGMKGYVTGDCNAVGDIFTGHNYAKSGPEAAAYGLKAGVDVDCGNIYTSYTIEAIEQGLITEADIDLALTNMFTLRMRFGEFDPKGMVSFATIQPSAVNTPEHQALAVEVATKTPVLLKNELVAGKTNPALPLNASGIKKIAVIGPLADKVELGPYSGSPAATNMISPLAGIRNYLARHGSQAEVLFDEGASTLSKSNLFNIYNFELVKTDGSVKKYDGTRYNAAARGISVGAGAGVTPFVQGIKDGDWTSYDNVDVSDIATVNLNLAVPNDGGNVEIRIGSPDGQLLASFYAPPSAGGFGTFLGSDKTLQVKAEPAAVSGSQTVYLVYKAPEMPEIDPQTLSLASSADVAVLFVGTNDRTAGEEADRISLELPGNQVELIQAVSAVNPNTIVVMQTVSMVETESFKNMPNVPAILWTGYNGQAQGTAMATILFGDVNPGGKLNASWYKSVNDLPDFTNYNLKGENNKRTYWYYDQDVSYEFGYGLSYTRFEFSNFRISQTAITPDDEITLSVDVKNTGDRDGDEVVQVYLRTPDSPASLQRPIKRLKGFQRVSIPAGQTKTVHIAVDCADLWFWDEKANRLVYDQGKYVFEIGASSKDIKGTVEATMSGELTPQLKTVVAGCGKVVLRTGNTVRTSITAAMSDDHFYDISKAGVHYTSNNPEILSVDENGTVTAKKAGVASVFASVTVNGKTVTDSYPLKVIPALILNGIAVDGRTVKGFYPETKGYSFLLADGTTKVPQVTAGKTAAEIETSIRQAERVPGTAVISLTDQITGEGETYMVNFGFKAKSDEFNSDDPGTQWTWIRENKANWSLTKNRGGMTLTGQQGDIKAAAKTAENLMLQEANTDWSVEAKMTFSMLPIKSDQQGGLIAFQDDDNYVKLVCVYESSGFLSADPFISLVVEDQGFQYPAARVLAPELFKDNLVITFRLVKKGSLYTASYSLNGKTFVPLGSAEKALADIRTGLIVCNGEPSTDVLASLLDARQNEQTPFEVICDYFRIKSSGLK